MRGADCQDPFELGKYKPKVPKKYSGVRDSHTLLKWLRKMESYLVMSQLGQAHYLRVVDSFLEQDASNWFESRGGYKGWRSWIDLK